MDSTFDLNTPGWYTVAASEKNEFLNQKLTSEQYGLWFSVRFEGDASTYLWQTKTEPKVGEKYWGKLETTSSGKSVKFKWDKQNSPANLPDGQPTSYTKEQNGKSDQITLGMVWKTVAGIRGLPEDDDDFAKFFEIVRSHTEELIMMSEKMKESSEIKKDAMEAFPDGTQTYEQDAADNRWKA